MKHLLVSLIVFGCVFASALIGLHFRKRLPEHHLSEESTGSIKLATGLIATIAALVLGLLISSAKGSFDVVKGDLVRNAINVIRFDRMLAQYGPETQDLRVMLRRNYAEWVDLLGSGNAERFAILGETELIGQIEAFHNKLAQLTPSTPEQRRLQARGLEISDDVFAARWLTLLQKEGSIPMPLLLVLVSWLLIIFAAFGLFAPRNGTVIFFFLMCAFSASGAIFVILELDTPLDGIIHISVAPMRDALVRLGS
jgi:hypothetical protein